MKKMKKMKTMLEKLRKRLIVAALMLFSLTAAIGMKSEADSDYDDFIDKLDFYNDIKNDLNFVVQYDNEGNVLQKSVAFGLKTSFEGLTIICHAVIEAPKDEILYYVTYKDRYEITTRGDGGNGSCDVGCFYGVPDDRGIIFGEDNPEPQQGDSAYLVYYTEKNNELELSVDAVSFTQVHENANGIIDFATIDHYPENALYPAVLVDENNEFMGWLMADDGLVRMSVFSLHPADELEYVLNDMEENTTEEITVDVGTNVPED